MQSTISGLLQKVIILAFEDPKSMDFGSIKSAKRVYRASVNPEKYSLSYLVKQSEENQAAGTSGRQLKYFYTPPDNLTIEFLFDGTGVLDNGVGGILGEVGVFAELEYFKNTLVGYHGDLHRPFCLMLIWGPLIFKGYATSLNIAYKLFNSSGIPIRATANVTFRKSIEDEKRNATEKTNSPDLTHILQVKAGDTLPLMCKKVYGDPKYYLQVADVNGLGNFRRLEPGMELVFPPIDKTTN